MTNKLYLTDSYTKEFHATVTSVVGNEVMLDNTYFYPTGGGQPCDLGTISKEGASHKVSDVKKAENDGVVHVLDGTPSFAVGDLVKCTLDWERRYAHMRYHTALHVIDAIVHQQYKGNITGGQIYTNKARLDFDVPDLNKEKVLEIISKAQVLVDKALPVTAKILTQEEALKIPNLAKDKTGRGASKEPQSRQDS